MATEAEIWRWLDEVPDPEIPVLSLVDLGVIRSIEAKGNSWVISITPTYSGCPATSIIRLDIATKLMEKGVGEFELVQQLSPPWGTDMIKPSAHEKLRKYGIAPPKHGQPNCPRCGSTQTELLSQFGSTPCKSHHRCTACLEPFDAFKCL